jgi:hypothetical protein
MCVRQRLSQAMNDNDVVKEGSAADQYLPGEMWGAARAERVRLK